VASVNVVCLDLCTFRLSEILEFLSESVIITELSSTKSALFNTIYRLYSDLNCTFMVLIKISWVLRPAYHITVKNLLQL
jgi:hypothetical protein